ncbi:MAG: SGNH/GDSL hydrolase family protein [Clostridia bacterium]|nr:SGNH/GDSL hydrolase family protein [Clostridia bacterium]
MTICEYIKNTEYPNPNEKPLDTLLDGGGLTSIFRTVAVIGDSLSSGAITGSDEKTGKKTRHDMYEYSWGQYIARIAGCTVYNFSRGGMTAKEYIRSFGEFYSLFDIKKAAQAYIIALGVNDIKTQEVGCADDMWDGGPDDTTIAGYYKAIIKRYKEIQPDGKFFLVTMPRRFDDLPEIRKKREEHRELLWALSRIYTNTYVIDLHEYVPEEDADYRRAFYLSGHMNPMGYLLTARMIMSYIDYIIRHNLEDFIQVPFIGTGSRNYYAKWGNAENE